MPKRSNPFQKLVLQIESALAPQGATVRESVELGPEKTEVDIVIEHKIGVHSVRIGIECRDESRKGGKEWIDGIAGKHKDLGVHRSVAVHSKGFTSGARSKADRENIELLTLSETESHQWTDLLRMSIALIRWAKHPTHQTGLAISRKSIPSIEPLLDAKFQVTLGDELVSVEGIAQYIIELGLTELLGNWLSATRTESETVKITRSLDTPLSFHNGGRTHELGGLIIDLTLYPTEERDIVVYTYGSSAVARAVVKEGEEIPFTAVCDSSGKVTISFGDFTSYVVGAVFNEDAETDDFVTEHLPGYRLDMFVREPGPSEPGSIHALFTDGK